MAKFENIRLHFFLLLCAVILQSNLYGQLNAYFASCAFNTPANKPFLETYFTFNGRSLFAKEENGKYRNSVHVDMKIFRDCTLVKINKYNLAGPSFADANTAPLFIDNQRYSLPNGNYSLEFTISDNHNPAKKPLVVKDLVKIQFSDTVLQCSAVQPLESFSKALKPGPLTKSGYDLVPYTVNFYPESSKELSFYVETYHADKTLGSGRPFVYTYYIETEQGNRLNDYGSFKKQAAAGINPLLGKLDISKLGSGYYSLVVEIKDEKNVSRERVKYNFQRLNRLVEVSALQNLSLREHSARFFGNVNNADTLKMFVECLWPIADAVDKERIVNYSVQKDPELMKKYVIDFWQRRAADTADAVKMWGTYYKSVQDVLVLFKCGKQQGYYTDRGRVYLQFGPPSQRSQQPNEDNTFPYEIWQYYRTTDATNGQFFSNRKFVFVNKTMGDDCYKLIHSDMRGEINNPRWQFEITRRNNNGLANPDNTIPAGTENNHFNELYTSPR